MQTAPIVYIFFNRPEAVSKTFPLIRAQRPGRLHLIADGPRTYKEGEGEKTRATRAQVESMIDWPCEVTRDYADHNLGCGRRISSGLTKAFADLGEAIILEDDILPHPDFFRFCSRMLEEHRNNERVHAISGFNPLGRFHSAGTPAAIASQTNCIWGWASWQRSWKDYTFEIAEWNNPESRRALEETVKDPLLMESYRQGFTKTAKGEIDTWDYQWSHCMLRKRRLNLTSTSNLIGNIGYGANATHTSVPEAWMKGLRSGPMRHHGQALVEYSEVNLAHDRLCTLVTMSGSPLKRTLARLLARHPALRRLA